MERRGNYEIQRDYAKTVFLKYDQEKIIRKLDLKCDENYIYLTFVSKDYRIERASGKVEHSKDSFQHIQEAGYDEVLSIYDLLCYSEEPPKASGVWAPINSVKYTPRAIGVQKDFGGEDATYADQHVDAFRAACGKLQGIEVPIGDLGYELPIFDAIKVRLKFYFSDDEFPAQLIMLWDEDVLKYMRYETTFYVTDHIYQRIREEAGELTK